MLRFQDRFYFSPTDPIFYDHFPENPVIPGSLILDCFQKAIENKEMEFKKDLKFKLIKISNSRFISFGRPGWIDLEIECKSQNNEINCKCVAKQEGNILAQALLNYANNDN